MDVTLSFVYGFVGHLAVQKAAYEQRCQELEAEVARLLELAAGPTAEAADGERPEASHPEEMA